MLEKIDIKDIKDIAIEAGGAIMQIYNQDFSVEYKDDKSPLTKADIKSNEIICKALVKLYPDIPIMSEENKQVEYKVRSKWEYYWCIDPIDGTKEFIKKNGEFTVNIALIHKHTPVLGVVYAPAIDEIYSAKQGDGAFLNDQKLPLKTNKDINNSINIVASKSHLSDETKDFIDKLTFNIKHSKLVSKGSSLKLCMVASGEADIYPRLAPTMEWDTAAADAIVRESGKMTYQFHSTFNIQDLTSQKPVAYNKVNLLNPWFVVK